MSLKSFHIFFILISITFAVGFGIWGVRDYGVSENLTHLGLGVGSFALSGGLTYYLFIFIAKMKKVAL